MSSTDDAQASTSASRGRGRGSHKSRGGLGKYLRARGRGRGRGRPAEFGKRLVLDGEEEAELDEGQQKDFERKYARRQLGTNADRYAEPEPELDSEGEEIVEPEVDLSSFLERQRLSEGLSTVASPPEEDDVDTSLARVGPRAPPVVSKKGRLQQVEWDAKLEQMRQEKAAAEATRDLKARFRAQTEKQRGIPLQRLGTSARDKPQVLVEPPPLPTDPPRPEKTEKEGMQDFLDDLLG